MLKSKLSSRKFWYALFGAILPILGAYLSADIDLEAATKASSAVICTYILGQGYVDAAKASTDD